MAKNRNIKKTKQEPSQSSAPSRYDPFKDSRERYWYCPYGMVEKCLTYEQHRQHPPKVELVAKITNRYHLSQILQREPLLELVDAFLARKTWENDSDLLIDYVNGSRDGWVNYSHWGEQNLKEEDKARIKNLSPLEYVLLRPLPRKALNQLVSDRFAPTPEAGLLFREQANVDNTMIINFMLNARSLKPQDLEDIFKGFSPQIDMALILLRMPEMKWEEPAKLLKASRTMLNLLSKDKETGTEIVDGLVDNWRMSYQQLAAAARNLL